MLKGGITSGVVYPLALVSLAEKYRFSNIGGTSAGAIAAAAAAAAEYGRHTESAGFDRLAKIPDEIGPNLLALFQPTPVLKPLFDIFVAATRAKSTMGRIVAIIVAAVRGYWLSALLGLLPGVIVVALTLAYGGGRGFIAFGLLLALIGLVAGVICAAVEGGKYRPRRQRFWPLSRHPPARLLRGRASPTGWRGSINEAAGLEEADRPLTFGDLAAPPGGRPAIQLSMMTTSLMEERPYTLPLPADDRRFVFEKSEWNRIFPSGVMTFLTSKCDRFDPPAGESRRILPFPRSGPAAADCRGPDEPELSVPDFRRAVVAPRLHAAGGGRTKQAEALFLQ